VTEPTPQVVTWIKVQKPALDLVGLILGSLLATALLALLAVLLGALGVLGLIRRRARSGSEPGSHLTQLHLPAARD
jgi:hypothetical protein